MADVFGIGCYGWGFCYVVILHLEERVVIVPKQKSWVLVFLDEMVLDGWTYSSWGVLMVC